MPSCKDKPEILVKVDLRLSYMSAVFIHPENHTYPIFSLKLNSLALGYEKHYDHTNIRVRIQNFQVHDTQNYPKTLDPYRHYLADEPVITNEIMGVSNV